MARSALAREFALCKHNHLHTVKRKWQDQHQWGGLHFASTITYKLGEGNGRININKRVCTLQAQSLTGCGKAMVKSASIRGFALCKYNHLLAVGRRWKHWHQQGSQHFASTVTYCLWECNGRISINKRGTLQAQPLTPYRKAMAGSISKRGLHLASTVTYILWEGNGRISISKGVCTLQAQSLTRCGKAMEALASARESALCKHSHLLPMGRQWQDQH